jgi:uncharacterized membrane protein YphA (DoxX/SURF4 family)
MSTTLYDTGFTRDRRSGTLNVWLWIAQSLLAVFFLLVGAMHAFMPIEQVAKFAAWVASAPVALVRFIGVAEIAGAISVVLPAATRVKPWLTPLAAVGLATIMVLAMPVHIARGELSMIGRNLAALSIASFVIWGRVSRVRISARAA